MEENKHCRRETERAEGVKQGTKGSSSSANSGQSNMAPFKWEAGERTKPFNISLIMNWCLRTLFACTQFLLPKCETHTHTHTLGGLENGSLPMFEKVHFAASKKILVAGEANNVHEGKGKRQGKQSGASAVKHAQPHWISVVSSPCPMEGNKMQHLCNSECELKCFTLVL